MNARLNTSAHADAQRDRILTAAQRCFAERGFHAATMASIADTAGISAGLIYRYFKSKHEIIHGIVQRQLEAAIDDLQETPAQDRDVVSMLVDSYVGKSRMCGSDETPRLDPALVMEITAESGRDPAVARMLDGFEPMIERAMSQWLRHPQEPGDAVRLPPEIVERRTLLLRFLLDGMKMHQVRRPDLDPALLRQSLTEALGWLRSP